MGYEQTGLNPYENGEDGKPLRASTFDWASRGYDGFLGFAIKLADDEGDGYEDCEDCACTDECGQESGNICFNLGATPISFNANSSNLEIYPNIEIGLDNEARSREYILENNQNIRGRFKDLIVSGDIKVLNHRNITNVISEDGDFIDNAWGDGNINLGAELPFYKNTPFADDFKYTWGNISSKPDIPTFSEGYNCQKYPSKVIAKYLNIEALEYEYDGETYTDYNILNEVDITIGLVSILKQQDSFFEWMPVGDTQAEENANINIQSRAVDEEGLTLFEKFKESVKGKFAIEISIEGIIVNNQRVENAPVWRWASHRADNLSVTSSNELLSREALPKIRANKDSWFISDTKITANLGVYRFFKNGEPLNIYDTAYKVMFTDSAQFTLNEDKEIEEQTVEELYGQTSYSMEKYLSFNISIDLNRNIEIFSKLNRIFYINLIYDTDYEPEEANDLDPDAGCNLEIRAEGNRYKAGFTDRLSFADFTAQDFWNAKNYESLTDSYAFVAPEAEGGFISNYKNFATGKMEKCFSILVLADLNWLKNLNDNEIIEIFAKGSIYCPKTFEVIVTNTQITSYNEKATAIETFYNQGTDHEPYNDTYAYDEITLPRYAESKVATITFNNELLELENLIDLDEDN